MQKERVKRLFQQRRQKNGFSFDDARRILWMFTRRDIYRMLVNESGWSPGRYQRRLSRALFDALVASRKST